MDGLGEEVTQPRSNVGDERGNTAKKLGVQEHVVPSLSNRVVAISVVQHVGAGRKIERVRAREREREKKNMCEKNSEKKSESKVELTAPGAPRREPREW